MVRIGSVYPQILGFLDYTGIINLPPTQGYIPAFDARAFKSNNMVLNTDNWRATIL